MKEILIADKAASVATQTVKTFTVGTQAWYDAIAAYRFKFGLSGPIDSNTLKLFGGTATEFENAGKAFGNAYGVAADALAKASTTTTSKIATAALKTVKFLVKLGKVFGRISLITTPITVYQSGEWLGLEESVKGSIAARFQKAACEEQPQWDQLKSSACPKAQSLRSAHFCAKTQL